jgi:uncharacterized membrane protein YkvA (DUF1232 family)
MNSLKRLYRLFQLLRRAGGVRGVKNLGKNLPKYLTLCRRLLSDNRVPASAKAVLVGAGAFAASPLNLPGFIPVIGALDDIGIALLAWDFFIKRVPKDVLAEHQRALGLTDDPFFAPA